MLLCLYSGILLKLTEATKTRTVIKNEELRFVQRKLFVCLKHPIANHQKNDWSTIHIFEKVNFTFGQGESKIR